MISNQKWDSKLYDSNHRFVSQYGTSLIHLLNPEEGESILDLGCGTGDLAKKISDLGSKVTGIDASMEMITKANDKYPELDFLQMDGEDIHFEESYDAVFSNAVLHWIKDPEKVLIKVNKSLKANGRFVLEFGGYGNCQMITNAIVDTMQEMGYSYDLSEYPWYFPKVSGFSKLLESTGYKVRLVEHYDRMTPLKGEDGMANWIKMFATKLFKDVDKDHHQELIDKAVSKLKPNLFINGTWYADYKRIRSIALKKG